MLANDYTLELSNIFHTGQVEPGSCFQRLCGSVQTGLILKDISLEVRAGEVLAVLGSKGSGKRALLEVISRRSRGPTRGQILLDGAPMTLSLYQRCCGYVSHRTDLLPSLSVEQTLHYSANLSIGSQVSGYVRSSRVRQVLADLALSQVVARRSVANLTVSEHRRLVVGMQLIKDPVLLLLDEPTADLDPLATYLVVSMLSSHARRRGRIVILTMEKPRSDVFPFLDRAAYLCLGDLVYAGPTRLMLEYFRTIGFPCPQLENPLMYYLCLSTVDRRSRERFIESNTQIIALVEKFKLEGAPYRKSSAGGASHVVVGGGGDSGAGHKLPFSSLGKPSGLQVGFTLYQRYACICVQRLLCGCHSSATEAAAAPLLLWPTVAILQEH
ncbi:LOW QUALITY PROTEIN: ATP-binding cassette sub-family G member 5-like [Homalodisca vitripennis]|nr:LOW QUALITY PROTEIN: ATP-binding cassette sub-family G member 5-like [Homalodisca vitripennis]